MEAGSMVGDSDEALRELLDVLQQLDDTLDDTLLQSTSTLPQSTSTVLRSNSTLPQSTSTLPQSSSTLPQSTSTLPQSTSTLPQSSSTLPQSSSTLPQSTSTLSTSTLSTSTLPRSTSTLTTFIAEPLSLPVLLFLQHHVNMCAVTAVDAASVLHQHDGAGGEGNVVGRGVLAAGVGRAVRRIEPPSAHSLPASEIPALTTNLPHQSHLHCQLRIHEQTESVLDEDASPREDRQSEEMWSSPGAALATLSCTAGLFNLSRFALFSVHFGGNFVVQFVLLSLVAGVPLLLLHMSLGRTLRCGVLSMWHISPILRGVGVALLATHALLALYTVAGLAWLFVYFRDSFITADDTYSWALSTDSWGGNVTLEHSVPLYWLGQVLQQSQRTPRAASTLGSLKFQTTFNLAVIWIIVFVALGKGLRSYSKAVYAVTLAPACGALALCTKLLTLIPADAGRYLLVQTEWSEFFTNTYSWSAAAQESFLTWGLLGACSMQVAARTRDAAALRRAAVCSVCATLVLLLLSALLGTACVSVLRHHGLIYLSWPSPLKLVGSVPGQFVWTARRVPVASSPQLLSHYGGVLGVTMWEAGAGAAGGGSWQPLQLATQLLPAALAALHPHEVSAVWAVVLYSVLITLGVGQQLVLWHTVVSALVDIRRAVFKSWETSITFCTCTAGLLSGLILATDGGVRCAQWLDYVAGGGWWVVVLQLVLVVGVLVVRGRPYSAEELAAALLPPRSRCVALLAALWTLALPPLMVTLCVVDFRAGRQRQLYWWRRSEVLGAGWGAAARRGGAALQQVTLLIVPLVAAVQTYRYLSKGPSDILDRIQNLYRPCMEEVAPAESSGGGGAERFVPEAGGSEGAVTATDPPPKYTPPPSYSTATGARVLHTLRRSIRAVRRLRRLRSGNEDVVHDSNEYVELDAHTHARVVRNALSAGGRCGGAVMHVQRLRRSLRKSFRFPVHVRSDSREQLTTPAVP